MKLIYTLIIKLYGLSIIIISPFNKKAYLLKTGRKDWKLKLRNAIGNKNWDWFHCSSFGEFEDFRELIKLYKQNSKRKIILTFHSPSGFECFKNTTLADLVFYIPLDTPNNAKEFLDIVKPKIIVFSRSDLWFNFLKEIKKREIKSCLVGLSLTDESNFLKFPQNKLYKQCFNVFNLIFTQNAKTTKLLKDRFNIYSITIGNTRIDRVYNASLSRKEYSKIKSFKNNKFCVVVGSSLFKDEELILKAIQELKDYPIKWIIVPHEINHKKIDSYIEKNQNTFTKYSIYNKNKNHNVMFVDFIGGLKHIYQYGDLAFVGGGFDNIGIHNIIEPAVYGLPIVFGPNHRNYPEAISLINIGGAQIINNHFDLIDKINAIINENSSNQNIIDYVIKNKGASQKILSCILK